MAAKSDNGGRDAGVIQSVIRSLDVLEVLANHGAACSIVHISKETGIPGPTVFRLLNTLSTRGYVMKTSRREYSIGPGFFALTASAAGSIGSTMEEVLASLVDKTGESASVATRDRRHALYIAHRPSTRAMRLFSSVGNRVPLHATGVGKSLMAAMGDRELDELLDMIEFPKLTEYTVSSPSAMREEIAGIRQRGYAVDNEEQEIGVRCVATWLPGTENFAVSISGPPSRMSDEYIEAVAWPALSEAAAALGDLLVGD